MKKIILVLLLTFTSSYLYSQMRIYKKNYEEVNSGDHQVKSLLNYKHVETIERQVQFTPTKTNGLIYVDRKPIFLFDKIGEKGDSKPVGVLTQTSFIEVDTIYYNETYKRPAKEWFVSFNVWYAIRINGVKYYTDNQIHEIAYEKSLNNLHQKFILACKPTGYDYYMDVGYPEYFFCVFLNTKSEIVFDSKLFDFVYNDEFWEESYGSIKVSENKGKFTFTLFGYDSKAVGVWDGRSLNLKKYKN